MRVYLAGPMRGYPDNNGRAFRDAAGALREHGYVVWSPWEHDQQLDEDSHAAQLRAVFTRDIEALLRQDAIVLMPGWRRSAGAALEEHAARVVGMPRFEFDEDRPGLLVALP